MSARVEWVGAAYVQAATLGPDEPAADGQAPVDGETSDTFIGLQFSGPDGNAYIIYGEPQDIRRALVRATEALDNYLKETQ